MRAAFLVSLWFAAAAAGEVPSTLRGEVTSFGTDWVDVLQPNGAVFRLPKARLENPNTDLRPGGQAVFLLSEEEIRKLRPLRMGKAEKGYQLPSDWPSPRPRRR